MKKNTAIIFLLVTTFFVGLFALTNTMNINPQVAVMEQDSDAMFDQLVLGDVEDTISVTFQPLDMTYLSGAIWVAPYTESKIYKVNPQTGATITSFNTPFSPAGLATDGTYLYATLEDTGSKNGTIAQFHTNGTLVTTMYFPLNSQYLQGLAWDGSHLWASQFAPHNILRINPSTKTIVANVSTGLPLAGLTWRNNLLWGVESNNDRIWAVNPSTGRVEESFDSPGTSGDHGLAYNGTHFLFSQFIAQEIQFLDIPTAVGEVWNQHYAHCVDTGDVGWNGTHYFVANSLFSTIEILHDGTFENVGEIALGFSPLAVTVAGNHVYVSSYYSAWEIHKYTTDGSFVATYVSVGVRILGLAYDGTHLWASDDSKHLYKLNPTDCSAIANYTTQEIYRGLTYDSQNKLLWAVVREINRLVQVKTADGSQTGTMIPTPTLTSGWGLAIDDEYLIYTDFSANYIYKVIIDFPAGGGIPGFADIFLFLSVIFLVGSILVLKRLKGFSLN